MVMTRQKNSFLQLKTYLIQHWAIYGSMETNIAFGAYIPHPLPFSLFIICLSQPTRYSLLTKLYKHMVMPKWKNSILQSGSYLIQHCAPCVFLWKHILPLGHILCLSSFQSVPICLISTHKIFIAGKKYISNANDYVEN